MSNRNQGPQDHPTTAIPITPASFIQPPRRPRKGTGRVAVAIYTALVAGIIGAAAATPTEPVASESPAPSPTVTVTAKPVAKPATRATVTVRPKPVVKTVTKEVTPQSCMIALNAGDDVVKGLEFILDWTHQYLMAVSEFNVVEMEELVQELTDSNTSGEFEGIIPAYESAAADCRGNAS